MSKAPVLHPHTRALLYREKRQTAAQLNRKIREVLSSLDPETPLTPASVLQIVANCSEVAR